MTQLIASNQLTLTNVNDGQSIKDNLFSATNFALTKYANPSQPTILVSWKYNGKPNTKYTLSTDVPKNAQGTYDLFFDVYPSTPSSRSNGVAINDPRTITTDATGIIEITARIGATVDSIIAKTNRVKLEENDMATAFIFHPDDQIGDKGADGKTPYIHWAYSDSADGTGLTLSDNGHRYIGNYSDYTQADSTDKTKYRWADRWANIDSKADQELTQEQLNALNERNQILESEMQAKASMEAFSEFEKAYQSFVKSNAEGQAKAEADLIEAGRRIELLTTQFGGLKELKTFIDTYMSSSNEGLIIGKNDASSTIKVSSDRISMFSAGKEVMYISQGVIHIDNGIFTVSVQIGRFRTEQYHLNADINVIRYVG